MIDAKQPTWVCLECGEKHRAGDWFNFSTWHEGVCGVCRQKKPVTEPRDCGFLKQEWESEQ